MANENQYVPKLNVSPKTLKYLNVTNAQLWDYIQRNPKGHATAIKFLDDTIKDLSSIYKNDIPDDVIKDSIVSRYENSPDASIFDYHSNGISNMFGSDEDEEIKHKLTGVGWGNATIFDGAPTTGMGENPNSSLFDPSNYDTLRDLVQLDPEVYQRVGEVAPELDTIGTLGLYTNDAMPNADLIFNPKTSALAAQTIKESRGLSDEARAKALSNVRYANTNVNPKAKQVTVDEVVAPSKSLQDTANANDYVQQSVQSYRRRPTSKSAISEDIYKDLMKSIYN